MNPEACCSSSCCYSSLQRTVRNNSRLSFAIRILSKLLPSFFCHNDGFFRKSPRPSFIDKAGCTRQFESELSLRSFAQLFPIKEGSTAFPKPLFSWRRLAALGNLKASFHCPHLHNLSPQGDRGCANRPTRCSNRFAIRLADHQRSRQQQSCGLRYATAWIQIAYMLLARCLLLMLSACSMLDACCSCWLLARCLMLAGLMLACWLFAEGLLPRVIWRVSRSTCS